MSDAVLTDLFRQQAQRLHRDILIRAEAWQAGDASALTPLRHAVHLLKGAALSASADAVALALHELEHGLQPGQAGLLTVGVMPLNDTLQQWLAKSAVLTEEAPGLSSEALPPDGVRRALRESFAAQVRLSDQPATLHLHLDPQMPVAPFLWDVLPQLLRNALVHGGESAEVRQSAGKPERLQVWLRLRRCGDWFSLIVADDGRGTARPRQATDLMAGRGWGVPAVREVVAGLPSGLLGFRCRAGTGSIVRIQWRAQGVAEG